MVERLAAAGVRAPSVGVSIPGIITRGGEIGMIVNLPWLEGRPLRQALEARLRAGERLPGRARQRRQLLRALRGDRR